MCSGVQATTNSFFLFLGGSLGFSFTVTVTFSTTFLVTDSEGACQHAAAETHGGSH